MSVCRRSPSCDNHAGYYAAAGATVSAVPVLAKAALFVCSDCGRDGTVLHAGNENWCRMTPSSEWSQSAMTSYEVVRKLAGAIVALATVASALGLLLPGVYRDNAWVTAQNRGTDLVTLAVIVPATAIALVADRYGSPRGRLVLFGLLGYFFYVYTGASFAYTFNHLFLLYVALFSLSLFALLALGSRMNAPAVLAAFDARTPWRATVAFMLWLAVMLCVIWLAQILPFYWTGEVPEGIRMADAQTMYVYVLDLGIVSVLCGCTAGGTGVRFSARSYSSRPPLSAWRSLG